jgi:7-cyano-7-deazaguanine synthase
LIEDKQKGVVLLSGGIDSSTCLAIANSEGFATYALSFRYHQRHVVEIESALRIANALGVRDHLILDVPLGIIGGSALTSSIDVPKSPDLEHMPAGIPVTYVPARNTVFLSLALAWAEVIDCGDIFIGVNALDYSGYPDCRPDFIKAFEIMANLATKKAVEGDFALRIHTPLINLTKAEIIRKAAELGLDLGMTHSCYDPDPSGLACGHCDSCLIRKKGFESAGIPDPTRYST